MDLLVQPEHQSACHRATRLGAVRVAVYTDYSYHRLDGEIYAERAFALFLAQLAAMSDRTVVLGRLDPSRERARYRIGKRVEFVPLPYYRTLARPLNTVAAMARSLGRCWRALDGIDCIWVLGPHPLAVAFAALAALRRKRVVLGVRQDTRAYVRARHRRRPLLRLAAFALDGTFRTMARACRVVAVGPTIAGRYRHARRLLEIVVSLVDEDEIVAPAVALERPYGDELSVLSVGRLDSEKNPLLLAEGLTLLRARDQRWRLVVCGEGPLKEELLLRLEQLGLADVAEVRGYVPFGDQLDHVYRNSHAFLHVSWTEGLPQVLFEAFASGLPVVATDVGGVGAAVGEAALLVPPGDPEAIADRLYQIGSDPALRARLVRSGSKLVRRRTIQTECRRVADFLAAP